LENNNQPPVDSASKPEQASRHKQGHSIMAQQHISMAAALQVLLPWRY